MFTTFERILLATEGTPYDAGAERLALELAAKCGSPLLAVRPVVSNPVYESLAPALAEKDQAGAAAQLEALWQEADRQGVTLNGSVRCGEEPGQAIVAEAHERNADLIVLRRRGKRGYLANMLVGALVHKVVGHAVGDVLIVPRAARMWSRGILLATDGSSHSRRATEAAGYLAARCGLPVVAVSVAGGTEGGDTAAGGRCDGDGAGGERQPLRGHPGGGARGRGRSDRAGSPRTRHRRTAVPRQHL